MAQRDARGRFVKGSGARSGKVANVSVEMRIEGLDTLAARLRNWDKTARAAMKEALILIGNAWVTEAKKRVPVNTGLLRNSINKSVTVQKGFFELAVGSNRRYAPFIEFGTRYIAGGAVQMLGVGPDIFDSEAITTWPALEERGGAQQQMPFLRPAWSDIKEAAIARMNDALKPPPSTGV